MCILYCAAEQPGCAAVSPSGSARRSQFCQIHRITGKPTNTVSPFILCSLCPLSVASCYAHYSWNSQLKEGCCRSSSLEQINDQPCSNHTPNRKQHSLGLRICTYAHRRKIDAFPYSFGGAGPFTFAGSSTFRCYH